MMIRRFLAAATLALGALLPAAAQTFTGTMSGSWWDSARSGEGQFIAFESAGARNVAYLAYFTYGADGRATWHVGSADYTPGAASISIPLVTGSGARFGAAFDPAEVRTAPAGTATLEFVSCTRMRMRHSAIPGAALELTRLVGSLVGVGCDGPLPAAAATPGLVSGSWWNAARAGEGQFITFESVGTRNVAYLAYFTYAADGAATWLVGNADVPVGARSVSIPLVTGSGARFGSAFRSQDVTTVAAGTATLEFVSCAALRLGYSGAQAFAHDLTRLVGPISGQQCVEGNPAPSPPSGEFKFASVASAQAAFTYPVSIYLPPGYSPARGAYRIVYAADAEFEFTTLANTVRDRGLDAIIVGIGNGGAERRFVDYALPGAEFYYAFLTRELMPLIETQYRVDGTKRTFAGYSLSGSFAGIAMLLEDPAARKFSSFISVDGSFWHQSALVNALEQQLYDATRSLPVGLYLASAANVDSIALFRQRLQGRAYQGLRLEEKYYGTSHSAVLVPGLVEGLEFVFGAP